MTAQGQITTSYTPDFSSAQIEASLINFLTALTQQNCSGATIRNYRSDIRQFYKFMEIQEMEELFTADCLRDFVIAQRAKGLKDSSITRKIASITQFALWSKAKGLIDRDISWMGQTTINSLINPAPLAERLQKKASFLKLFQHKPAPKITEIKPEITLDEVAADTKITDTKLVSQFAAQVKPEVQRRILSTPNLFLPYLNLALTVVFFIGLAFLGYNQLMTNAPISMAYPSNPVRASRVLSFQGRLTDTAQNPITVPTTMEFKIWDQLSGGTEGTCDGTNDCEYKTGSCSVTPDQDGIFNVGIGDTCGIEIDDAVFTENPALWLEVKISTETLTPRQPIRVVPFAINSETLQGYPISATQAATANTVLVMDAGGNVTLGENNPKLTSVSGTFTIGGVNISLDATTDLFFSDARITNLPLSLIDTQIDPALSQAIVDAINDVYGITVNESFFDQTSNLIYPQEYWTDEFAIGGNSTASADIWLGNTGAAVFNEQGNDADFRVEGDNDPNTLFVDASTDRVGVGTNTPSFKLTVNGGTSNGTINTSAVFYNPGAGTGTGTRIGLGYGPGIGATAGISGYFDGTGPALGIFTGASNTQQVTVLSSGSVGIGDTTPDHLLDVAGNIGLDASAYINWSDVDGTAGYGFRDNGGTLQFKNSAGNWTDFGTASNTLWQVINGSLSPQYITQDINLGNAATASANISLRGSLNRGLAAVIINQIEAQDIFTASASGNTRFTIASNGDLILDNAEYISNSTDDLLVFGGGNGTTNTDLTVDLDGTNPVLYSTAGLGVEINDRLYIGTNNHYFYDEAGQLSLSSSLGVDASMTIGTLNATGNTGELITSSNIIIGDQGDLRLREDATNGTSFTGFQAPSALAGDVIYTLPTGDGTGGYFLTTNGTGTLSWTSGFVENPSTGPWTHADHYLYPDEYWIDDVFVGGETTASADINFFHDGGAVFNRQANDADFRVAGTTDANLVYVDASTNRVGIGDATPDHKLDVAGNIGLDAAGYINWGDVDGTAGYGFRDNSGTLQFKNSAGAWTDFGTGSGTGGYWALADGVVHPYNLWPVVNFGNVATNSAKVSIAGSLDRDLAAMIVNQTETGGSEDIFTASASGVTKFVIDENGNVGIGTDAPGSPLSISAATTASQGQIRLVNGPSWPLIMNQDAFSNFTINNGNITRLTLDANGNFGVGDTSPDTRLDVEGAVTGQALVQLNELGDQDILVGSVSGSTRFRFDNSGQLYAPKFIDYANSAYYLDPAATLTALSIAGEMFTQPGTFESGVTDGASAKGYTFDTTNSLTTAGALLADFQNQGTSLFTIDKDGNVWAKGNIYSDKGFGISMKNIGPALTQYDLVAINTTEDNTDGVPRMSATDSAFAKVGFGVVQEACTTNSTCKVVFQGESIINMANDTNRGDYIFSSTTLGKGGAHAKQYDGMLGIATSTDLTAPYQASMIFLHQPAVEKLRIADKNRMHADYREAAIDYLFTTETNRYNVDENIRKGLYFDTFQDKIKMDSVLSSAIVDTDKMRAGLFGGVTYNATNTDTAGNNYLGATDANDVYYYDRTMSGDVNAKQDSTFQTLVELGTDPNWYNGVVLDASSSANSVQNPPTNLSTSYNGSLIKATGRYATGEEDGPIILTIKTDNEATDSANPSITFDWATSYDTATAEHKETNVIATKGTPYTLETGTNDIAITFSHATYHAGDKFKILSWYLEPETANDRGDKQQFPTHTNIIANSNGFDIIDADTNKLWMRFNKNNTNMIQGETNAVHALNGQIYLGSDSGEGGPTYYGNRLFTVNFAQDQGNVYEPNDWIYGNGAGISERNAGKSWWPIHSVQINDSGGSDVAIKDVHAAVVSCSRGDVTTSDYTVQTPTLVNSWTNYNASAYNTAGYWKDKYGVVHLKGMVAGGAVGSTIFTLPVGYRPAYTELFITQSVNLKARVDVTASGAVVMQAGNSSWITLEGLNFRVSTANDPAWTAPTFQNSWVDYGGAFNPAGYWKDYDGVVHLRGLVKNGTVGLAIFTLPTGYRPAATELLRVDSSGAIGRVDISTAGAVTLLAGTNTYVSLDGLTFRDTGSVSPAWNAPTFLGTWANYGSGYNNAGYWKDSSGIVHLRGLVASGTIPSTIFTLPAGYRPSLIVLQDAITNPNVLGQIYVYGTGEVYVTLGNAGWISLDGITFQSSDQTPYISTQECDHPQQHVAVATNQNLSVLKHLDNKLVVEKYWNGSNYGYNNYNAVWLTSDNKLYGHNSSDNELQVWNAGATAYEQGFLPEYYYDETTTPAIYSDALVGADRGLAVTENTSLIDGTSDTVYFAHNLGLSKLESYDASEADSAVKYYTQYQTTDELIGNTKAFWGMQAINATDLSKNTNNATASNTPTLTSGVRGLGITFNGTNQYLTVADNDTLTISSNTGSWSYWLKRNGNPTAPEYTFVKGAASNWEYGTLIGTAGNVSAYFWTPAGSAIFAVTSTQVVTDNQWHQITFSNDGTTGSLYIDGKLDSTGVRLANGDQTNGTAALIIGDRPDVADAEFEGSLDEFLLSGEILSAGQIRHMYETGKRALSGSHGINDQKNNFDEDGTGNATWGDILSVGVQLNSDDVGYGPFAYVAGNNTLNADEGWINKLDVGSDTIVQYYRTTTDPAIPDNDVTSLAVSDSGLELVGMNGIGAYVPGLTSTSNDVTGSYYSDTVALPDNINNAYAWVNEYLDTDCASCSIAVYGSNNGGSTWTQGTSTGIDTNQALPEYEYLFSFPNPGNSLKLRVDFTRDSSKDANIYIEKYGIAWFDDDNVLGGSTGGVFTQSGASVANGSYIEINHAQNTNDLLSQGWLFDVATGTWRDIGAATESGVISETNTALAHVGSMTVTHNQNTFNVLAQGYYYDATQSAYIPINEPQGQDHKITASPDDGLKGFWRLNEASGDLVDSSRVGNTLIDKGTPIYQIGGKVDGGYAINLDGTSDYFCTGTGTTCADDNDFDPSGAFSVGAWVNTARTTNQAIMAKAPSGAATGWTLGTTGGVGFTVPYFSVGDGTQRIVYGNTGLADGKWHLVVGVFSPSTQLSIYVDGKLDTDTVSTVPAAVTGVADPFELGASSGGLIPFAGSIDDPFFYTKSLTFVEIQALSQYGHKQYKIENPTLNTSRITNLTGYAQNVKLNVSTAGFRIQQVDTNTIRLYNYSGATQELRLDVATGGVGQNTGFVTLAPLAADVDANINSNSIWINKTDETGLLLKLQNDGINRFTLDYGGNATISGSLKVGGQLQLGSFVADPTAMGEGSLYYNSVAGSVYFYNGTSWQAVGTGSGANLWQVNTGALSPINLDYDVNLGNIATDSANISLRSAKNRGKAAVIINQTENQDILAASSSGTTKFRITNTGDVYLTQALRTTYNANNYIDFIDSGIGVNSYLSMHFDLDDDNNDSTETFTVRTNAGTSELFRINNLGNVGIGDTSPEAKLDVEGANTGQALVQLNEMGDQDILTGSVSGSTRFRIDNNGQIYANKYFDYANSAYFLDPAATLTALSVAGKIYTQPGTFESGVVDGASAKAYTFNTTNSLTTAGALLADFQNQGTSMLTIDKDGNLWAKGNIYSDKGFGISMKNVGPTLSQYDLVAINTTEDNTDAVPRMTATDSAFAKVGFGVVQEACTTNSTCKVVFQGESVINVSNETNRGQYLFSSATLGKAAAHSKQFDGMLGIATSTDLSAPYQVNMIFLHQPSVDKLRVADKNRMHADYREAAQDYISANLTNYYDVDENVRRGLFFDTFQDKTKIDSSLADPIVDDVKQRAGLFGGVTMNATNTDVGGSTFLGSADANKVYFYDRSQTGDTNAHQDSTAAVLVDLGIDPNWYNGVTLDASESGYLANSPATNLSTSYNGALIKVSGTYAAGEEDGGIIIKILSDNEATDSANPSLTFNWNTNSHSANPQHSGSNIIVTKGTAYTLETGTNDITVQFTHATYHAGDIFRIASWYIEPETANDRGDKQQFPQRSYLIAQDNFVDIIDADTNRLWMRFNSDGNSMLANGGAPYINTDVHMLNGHLYVTNNYVNGQFRNVFFDGDDTNVYATTAVVQGINDISRRNNATGQAKTLTTGAYIIGASANKVHAAVVPNNPTQEVTLRGWGYIQGDNTAAIEEAVYFQQRFTSQPKVQATTHGYKATTAPNSLAECTTTYTIAGDIQPTTVTNNSFVANLAVEVGVTFASTAYFCYTWEATGTIAPRQYAVVGSGNATTDGGVSIIDEAGLTATHVIVGTTHANVIYGDSVFLANDGSLYLEYNDVTSNSGVLAFYPTATTIPTEPGLLTYYGAYYRVAGNDSISNGGPWIYGTANTPYNQITDLKVTAGTSTANPGSNTIYVSTINGLTVLQEKYDGVNLGDTAELRDGTAKFYTKDFITEEMLGDVRGMWPFNGNNTASDFEDTSKFSHNLLNNNIGATDAIAGVRGEAYDFDGSSEYVYYPDDADLDAFSTMSVGAWVRSDAHGSTQTILSKGYGAGVWEYNLFKDALGNFQWYNNGGGANYTVIAPYAHSLNEWHYVVGTFNGVTAVRKLYVDGELVAQTTNNAAGSTVANARPLVIGANDNGVGIDSYFNGAIDEPFVSAEELTLAQIRRQYEVGRRALQSHGINNFKNNFDEDGTGNGSTSITSAVGIQLDTISNNGPFAYLAFNNTSVADDGFINKLDLGSDTVTQYIRTTTDPSIPDNDASTLSVSDAGLEIVGMDGIGAVNPGLNSSVNNTTGTYYSDTVTLPDDINHAYAWLNQYVDADCATCNITVYASNDGGSTWTQGTLTDIDTNQSLPEREYLFSFPAAGGALKFRADFTRDSGKASNVYIKKFGIAWFNDDNVLGGSTGGVFTQSGTAVANGGYVEIAHAQNTNDLIANGWIYNTTTNQWEDVAQATASGYYDQFTGGNLVMNYPSLENAKGHDGGPVQPEWWEVGGTATLVEASASTAGVTGKHETVLKLTQPSSSPGYSAYQIYDVSAEPTLVENVTHFSAGAWVYSTAGSTSINIYDENTAANLKQTTTTVTGQWTYIKVEDMTVGAADFRLRISNNTANAVTYIAMPQLNVGPKVMSWNERGLREVEVVKEMYIYTNYDPTGYLTVDLTGYSSPLTAKVELFSYYLDATANDRDIFVYRYGSAGNLHVFTRDTTTADNYHTGTAFTQTDDLQRVVVGTSIPADTESLWLEVSTYWEWDSGDPGIIEGGPFQIVQTDKNTVRLYNYSGATQQLRLDVAVGGVGQDNGNVTLSPLAADVDATANTNSIWINKTDESGNLLRLQNDGLNRLTLDYGGNATLSGTLTINGAPSTAGDPSMHVEGDVQLGSNSMNDVEVNVYGNIYQADDTKINGNLTNIQGSELYDTTRDTDGGAWRKATLTKSLSYYSESKDDGFLDACNPSTDDRCGTSYFPAKANIIYTDDAVYIFDVSTNTMWMKFSQGASNAIGAATNSNITSVHGVNGHLYIGTRGAADSGLYEIDFTTDTMFYYDITDRSESNQAISGRNGGANTFNTNNMTAFAISNNNVNDIDSQYNRGSLFLAIATDSGLNLIDTTYQVEYEYIDVASNANAGDTITDDGNGASGDATNAFDSQQATFARSDVADNIFIVTYQFATPQAIQRYIMESLDATFTTQAPEDWTLQASNTGAFAGEQVTFDTVTGRVWANIVTAVEEGYYVKEVNPAQTAYTYWRVHVTDPVSVAADQVDFSELRFMTRRQKSAVKIYADSLGGNYSVNASSLDNGTTYSPRRVTDWSRKDAYGEYRSESGNTTPWTRITLRAPKVITNYMVGHSNGTTFAPTAWQMQGSNDGVTWTTLDTQTAQTFATYQNKTYTFSNSTAYKNYRLNVTAINGSTTSAEVGEFQVGVPVITASGSNNNTSQDETNLIFQDQADTAYYWIAVGTTGQWVQYDYGAGNERAATSFGVRGYQPTLPARAIKNFRLQGSNNASTWTDLSTQTNQVFADDYLTLKTYEFANTTAYRYYRLYVDNNNGDATYTTLRGFYVFGEEERIIAQSVFNGTTSNDHEYVDEDDLGAVCFKTGNVSGWVEKHFAFSNTATISALVTKNYSATNLDPRDFTFSGSNDRTTWTTLETRDHIDPQVVGQQQGYLFGNNTPYQFYRFNIDAIAGGAQACLQELKLLGGQYNNVRFVDNALVGTNASLGQVEIFQNLWDEEEWDQSVAHDLRYTKTGEPATDLDIALSANPSGTRGSGAGNNYIPALSGGISETKYGLEADGSEIFVGHVNGVDRIYSAPNPDFEGTEARARITGTYNNSRIISNKYGFDHFWPMDEEATATKINDYGTAGGSSDTFGVSNYLSVPTSTASGKIGRAYEFDTTGTNYIVVEDELVEEPDAAGGDYSYGGWMYRNAEGIDQAYGVMGDYYYVTNCGTGTQTCRYGTYVAIRANANTLYVAHCTAAADVACTIGESYYQIPIEQWVHFVVQRRNTDVTFYINGENVMTYTLAGGTVDGLDFHIGNFGSILIDPFEGRLDEVFIKYGEVLTQQQIRELYQEGIQDKDAERDIFTPDGSSASSIAVTDATGFSSTTIADTSLNLTPNFYQGRVLEITGGTGVGQTRLISKHTANTFTVSPAWSVTPDTTSDFEITPNALPGSINASSAIRADMNDVFVGLNNGADGGGVVRIDRDSQTVVDYYHGLAGKTDDHSGSWNTTTGYDDVVGISTTQDNLMITAKNQYWREKVGDSLWEAIDKLQQGFSAGVVDSYTQEYDGANVRNTTKTVMRKGWSYITSLDSYKTVYYGISYDEPPIVLDAPAGVFLGDNVGVPASLESCANLTITGDDLAIAAINKDNFIISEEAGTTQQCFTWLSLGDYSGSMPDGSFAGGADLAEWYGTEDETLTAGEVVSIAPSADIKVSRSQTASDHTAIGIIATQPSITMGPESGLTPGYSTDPQLTKGAKTSVQVALAGRVPVKVSLENGKIKAGDYLTTASKPGYAAKAITAGPVLGQALEDFDGSNTVVAIIDPTVEPNQAALQNYLSGMTNFKAASSSGGLETAVATPSALALATAEPVEILDQDMLNLKNGYGTIMAFVNPGYGDPEAGFTYDAQTGKATVEESIAKLIPDFAKEFIENIKTVAQDAQIFVSERIEVFTKIFARVILSQELRTELISPIAPDGNLTIQLGQDKVATESGESSPSQLVIKNASGSAVTTIDSRGNILTLGDLVARDLEVSSISAQNASISGEIDATSARLQKLESKLAQFEALNAQTAEIVNATVSGTLFADNIDSFAEKVASVIKEPTLLAKLTEPFTAAKADVVEANNKFNETSSKIGELDTTSATRLSLNDLQLGDNDLVLEASAAYINQYLDVNGSAYVAKQLGIGESLVLADSMFIAPGSIDFAPLSGDKPILAIQSSGRGLLTLMGNLFTLDENGLAKLTGDLSVSGNVNVGGTLLTNLLALKDFGNPFQMQLATRSGDVLGEAQTVTQSRFEIVNELGTPVATISAQGRAEFAAGLGIGSEDLNNASDSGELSTIKTSGTATITSGKNEIIIKSKIVTEKSLIYLTPLGSTNNQVLYVKDIIDDVPETTEIESAFKVGFDHNLTSDLRFNWWIVN